MGRVIVIGATGHVGSYLVPRLVRAGHEVVALSRGARDPYVPAPEWRAVERVQADREAEDAAGIFGERIAGSGGDAVVDMLCFTAASASPRPHQRPVAQHHSRRQRRSRCLAAAGHRRSSASETPGGTVEIVDLWASAEQAAAFQREHLFPAFEASGVMADIGARPQPVAYEPFDYVA